MSEPLKTAPDFPYDWIEWRPDGKPTGDGNDRRCRWVAYVDARHVARMLDEWVGPANWANSYDPGPVQGTMWCSIAIRDPATGEWVSKSDIGKASQFEAEKGLVSDAFKRAAVAWGIARNVYALPFVWAACGVDRNGNPIRSKDSARSIERALKQAGVETTSFTVAESSPDAAEPAPKKAPGTKKSSEKAASNDGKSADEPREMAKGVDVAKARNHANALDAQGKAQVKDVLAEVGLTKKQFHDSDVDIHQLAAIEAVIKLALERMGEPWDMPTQETLT